MSKENKPPDTIEDREETIGGYKITGTWSDIVEHGERLSAAIRRVLRRREEAGESISEEQSHLEEFDEWRPKSEDHTKEISERTAEKASVEEGPAEKAGKTVKDSVDDAQNKMKETVDSASNLEPNGVKENATETVTHTQEATDSLFRKTLRWFEEHVYEHVMTLISPYYFDNELINANLTDKRGEKYGLEINIADDSIRDDVRDEMDTIDEEAPQWRIETDVNTKPAEEAEGIQKPTNKPTKDQVEESVEDELDDAETGQD